MLNLDPFKKKIKIEWHPSPIPFKNKMVSTQEEVNKQEYKNLFRVASCFHKNIHLGFEKIEDEKSYLWLDPKSKTFYFQLAKYYPKRFWIKLKSNDHSQLDKELGLIKERYYNAENKKYDEQTEEEETEKIYYIGLIPEIEDLENLVIHADPFSEYDLLKTTPRNKQNQVSVIRSKYTKSIIEIFVFKMVEIEECFPCYLRVRYYGNKMPIDLLGTIDLFETHDFDDFKINIIKSNKDINWLMLIPGLLTFDKETFIEILDMDFTKLPSTENLISKIADLII